MNVMRPGIKNHDEQRLVNQALIAFERETGLELKLGDIEQDRAGGPCEAVVTLQYADQPKFRFETRRHLTQATLGAALGRLKAQHERTILVTEYVNPRMAERLKALDVYFLDAAGNAYLSAPPVYVYVHGRKPALADKPATRLRAFQTAGLRLIFILLCRPEFIARPYRDLAVAAGIAVGTVAEVMKDLRERRFLVNQDKRNRRMLNVENLLNRWVEAYAERLRPDLLLGRYRADRRDWWQETDITGYDALWGGEIAGARLTGYLRPEVAMVYADKVPARLLLEQRLRKDPRGTVEIMQVFWQADLQLRDADCVHPLLVYADLLATGEPRNIETAQILRNGTLAGYFATN